MAADLHHLPEVQAGLMGDREGRAAEVVAADPGNAHLSGLLADGSLCARMLSDWPAWPGKIHPFSGEAASLTGFGNRGEEGTALLDCEHSG